MVLNGKGLGWIPDLPDVRDYSLLHPQVNQILTQSAHLKSAQARRAATVDLRPWCSPIEDQQSIGSCTAHAGVGMFEWFQKRAFGKYVDLSRLFLYKATRDILDWKGDQGAYLRTTMQAMVMLGAPPEKMWPYVTSKFDVEPTAFLYSMAENYKGTKYYRVVPSSGQTQLDALLATLAGGLPFMFGFTVYSSISNDALIPFPKSGDQVEGGHAIMAVGYDDAKKCFLIRNSWGTSWGDHGYGYLPYDYVTKGLADDFWSLVSADYINTDLFK